MERTPGPFVSWLVSPRERLQKRGEVVRLPLTAADAATLAAAAAWAGAAKELCRAAAGATRLEVSVPEGADELIHVAVNELARQGLRFLQLQYEKDAAGAAVFVAQF